MQATHVMQISSILHTCVLTPMCVFSCMKFFTCVSLCIHHQSQGTEQLQHHEEFWPFAATPPFLPCPLPPLRPRSVPNLWQPGNFWQSAIIFYAFFISNVICVESHYIIYDTFWSWLFKISIIRYKYCYPSFCFPFRLHEIFVSIPLFWVCGYLSFWGGALVGSIYMGLVVVLSFQLPCLLIESLNPFTFKLIIDRYVFTAILFF